MSHSADVLCLHCGRELVQGLQGWEHRGGGRVWFTCGCSWSGARPMFREHRPMCPACGRTDRLREHHVAVPNAGGAA